MSSPVTDARSRPGHATTPAGTSPPGRRPARREARSGVRGGAGGKRRGRPLRPALGHAAVLWFPAYDRDHGRHAPGPVPHPRMLRAAAADGIRRGGPGRGPAPRPRGA
ncbi:GNAT family N-acetyltransferase, partial [Streptomyces heliomycini]